VPAKLLAKVTGLLASMSLVTGPVSGLFSRFSHRALATRTSWRGSVSLDFSALAELAFWQNSLEQFSSRPIWRPHSLILVLQYNAGADGWGGQVVVQGVKHRAHGAWGNDERHGVKSSTWRELTGLHRLLLSVGHFLRGFRVIARGDALNAFFLLHRGGSRLEHLQRICLDIFWLCQSLEVDLVPKWVPREANQLADYLSKIVDIDDFSLHPAVFRQVQHTFGPLEVDRFASAHNAKLPVFVSEIWTPDAAGANAFTTSWSGCCNYCFPPPKLVFRTLKHAEECGADMVLMVLDWPGQPWWPLLVRNGGADWAPFVRRYLRFIGGPKTLCPGCGSAGAFFGHGIPACDVYMLDISFACTVSF
jgi:hypothetical protein